MRARSASITAQLIHPTPPTNISTMAMATSASTARTVVVVLLAGRRRFVYLLARHPLQLAFDHLLLERADVIDEEAVQEMVVLVLHRARVQPLALDGEGLALDVQGAHAGAQRAL